MLLKIFCLALTTHQVSSTIGGLSYMDPINQRDLKNPPRGENPCNPLYWYPRQIPEYCNFKPEVTSRPKVPDQAIAVPIPVPAPAPMPQPYPMPMPVPPPAVPYPIGIPMAPPPAVPLPFGLPLAPTNPMIPVPGPYLPSYSLPIGMSPMGVPPMAIPPMGGPRLGVSPMNYPPVGGLPMGVPPIGFSPMGNSRPSLGMVPGLPGLVTRDGGINILPFSDAYADMFEKHKNRMMRKKLRKLMADYDRKKY